MAPFWLVSGCQQGHNIGLKHRRSARALRSVLLQPADHLVLALMRTGSILHLAGILGHELACLQHRGRLGRACACNFDREIPIACLLDVSLNLHVCTADTGLHQPHSHA